MDADLSVAAAPVTRRRLLLAGAAFGLSAVARPAVEETTAITAEDVANALNGCLGVTDFTLLLRIKPGLRAVHALAQPLPLKLSFLADRTKALADQVQARSFPAETNALAAATVASTTQLAQSVPEMTATLDKLLDNHVTEGQTSESI